MDEHGGVLDPTLEPDVTKEEAVRMYQTMVQLNVMDSILYEAQRQARSTASLRIFKSMCFIWH